MTYPGMISRQDLVDFLQAKAKTVQTEASSLYDAADKAKDKVESEAFLGEYWNSLAMQRAYREVAEWAKKQVEHGRVT